MNISKLEQVRLDALRLSESDRAELAQSLIASLDGPADPNVEAAWDAEILRRVGEIADGTAKLIDRDELRRRIQARLRRT